MRLGDVIGRGHHRAMGESDLVTAWRAEGELLAVAGHELFVVDKGSRDGPAVVLLHGFPGSSFDWREVIDLLASRWRVVTFDFLGFGLSPKPDQPYSLFAQADLVEDLLAAKGIERAVMVAHDMGDTVAAELLVRATGGDGRVTGPTMGRGVGIEWLGCVLTNGSIFIDMAQLTSGQQLLLSLPDERLAEGLGEESLANGLRQSFPPDRPDLAELEAMVALMHRGDGDRLLPRLIRYIEERRSHQPRFTAGLVDYAGPMIVAWGDLDPIAVPAMADRLAALRTEAGHDVELVHWPNVGHWPAVEAPTLVAGLLAEL
jgi:pimeloyl-ACP methyl ester carboxylesterase